MIEDTRLADLASAPVARWAQRAIDIPVAEELADQPDIDAVRHRDRGEMVPQVMDPQVR